MFALHFAWILLGFLLGFLLKQNIIYPLGYKMQDFEINKTQEITKEESDIKKKVNKEKKIKKRKYI